MTTEPKHTPGAMNAARALCLPPEWTEAAATIDRETQLPALLADNERLREALRCLADVGKDLLTKQLGAQGFARLQTAVMDARAALSATENKSTTP